MDAISRAAAVASPDDFMKWIMGPVAALLPHEVMVCGIGEMGVDGNFSQKFLNRDYPIEYYFELRHSDGKVNSPLIQRWRQTQQPVVFQGGRDDALFPAEWVALFNKYGLRNIVGHGMLDLQGQFSSYFIFSRMPGAVGVREAELLNLITPHLHHALARVSPAIPVFNADLVPSHRLLTERQLEILHWVNIGKSNGEIASIVNTTQANVKYHLDKVYQKLDVATRVQAVARAKDLGLLGTSRSRGNVAR